MTLQIDYATEQAFALIVSGLRSARLDSGLSQEALSHNLPIRGRAISEWEIGSIHPTLKHLIQWSWALNRRLVVTDRNGEIGKPPRQRAGDSWDFFERRRLAVPLRARRQAMGLSQEELACRVGVSRDTIQRWELVRVPPRPIAHVVWAHKLGYSLVLRPASVTHVDVVTSAELAPPRGAVTA